MSICLQFSWFLCIVTDLFACRSAHTKGRTFCLQRLQRNKLNQYLGRETKSTAPPKMASNGIQSYLRLDDLAIFFNVCCISALFLPGLEVVLEASEVAIGGWGSIWSKLWKKSIWNGMEWHETWMVWGCLGWCLRFWMFFPVPRCSLPCKTSSHVVVYGLSHWRLEEIASRVVGVAMGKTTILTVFTRKDRDFPWLMLVSGRVKFIVCWLYFIDFWLNFVDFWLNFVDFSHSIPSSCQDMLASSVAFFFYQCLSLRCAETGSHAWWKR